MSHNIGAVRNLCDRAVYLRNGSVVEVGDADTVVDTYLNSTISTEERELLKRPRFPGLTATFSGFSVFPGPDKERVYCGGEAIFEFQLDVKEPLKNACLGIMLNSDKGYRVLEFYSRLELRGVTLNPGKQTVRCKVNGLPLKHGRYMVDIDLRTSAKLYDYLEHAASVDVEYDDFYGTGEQQKSYEGSILHRAAWEF